MVPYLPLPLNEYLETCSLSIWTLLNKEKMFPGKRSFTTIFRKTCGKGCEALRLMIMQNHPMFMLVVIQGYPTSFWFLCAHLDGTTFLRNSTGLLDEF
jgi:hypothetical protein